MIDVTYVSLKHALDADARKELLESVRPTAGYALTEVSDSSLTYVHQDPRTSWLMLTYTHDGIISHEVLGDDLLAGGCGEYGVLRFPNDLGWAKQDEALAFWTQILPVKPHRILFTYSELDCVYIQLANGMIVSLKLQWEGQDMENEDVIKTIFTKIIESNRTT
jgi:hypothetical protein